MHVARADSHKPDLRSRNTFAKPLYGFYLIRIHFILACIDVDGRELARVLRLEVRADLALVKSIAAPGEFLFAVSRFARSHTTYPPHQWPYLRGNYVGCW